jgi:O-antigen ligase
MVSKLERAFVVFALMFFSDAVLTLLEDPNRELDFDVTTTDPIRATVALAVYVILVAFWLCNLRVLTDALRSSKLLLSLIALAVVSASWSPDPAVSAKRAVLLLATTLFGIYFAARFDSDGQLRIIAVTMAIALGASIIMALAFPSYGTQAEMGGAWRGIFWHKNQFGKIGVLSAFVFLLLRKQTPSRRWFWNLALVLALVAVVLSRSATAIVVVLAVGLSLIAVNILRLPVRLGIPVACIALAMTTSAAVLATANMDFVFASLGREATLTGRTDIWTALKVPIAKHLWLGYGYGGYWLGPGSESEAVAEDAHWDVKYAHNGFLDMTLQLGAVGLAAFSLLFWMYTRAALRLARSQRGGASLWPVCYLVFMLCYNFSDSTLMAHNSLFWVLFVGISLPVIRTTKRSVTSLDIRASFPSVGAELCARCSTVPEVRS